MVMHACKHITRLSPFSVSSTLMKIKFPMKEKKNYELHRLVSTMFLFSFCTHSRLEKWRKRRKGNLVKLELLWDGLLGNMSMYLITPNYLYFFFQRVWCFGTECDDCETYWTGFVFWNDCRAALIQSCRFMHRRVGQMKVMSGVHLSLFPAAIARPRRKHYILWCRRWLTWKVKLLIDFKLLR